MAQIKKQLQEILVTQEFTRLDPFRDKTTWREMTSDERELLGLLLVMQGEKELIKGNEQVLESFKLAAKVSPKNPVILFRQAMAFASQEHNIYCMTSACRLFEKIVKIEPTFFEAWFNWGNVLIKLGVFSNEMRYFEEADHCFKKAETHSTHKNAPLIAALYRHWGVAWYYSGKLSGEAGDFKTALSKYQKAVSLGMETEQLWNDQGNALVELSLLINQHQYLLEAVEYYWKSTKINPNFYEGWLNLALCCQRMFLISNMDSYFNLSIDCYESASKLEPHHALLWHKWGDLYLTNGKNTGDPELFRLALEKLQIADECEPNNPMTIACIGDALMMWGYLLEDLEKLTEASKKFFKCLELQPDNPFFWELYGQIQMELGYYFSDMKYFKFALEQFQKAYSLDKKNPKIWHRQVLCYLAMGELKNDKKLFKQAAKLCMRVVDCGGGHVPVFWNDWGVILMKLATLTNERRYIEAALTKFEQAIRLQKTQSRSENVDPEWMYNYGCALDFLGDFQEPASNYEKAIQVLTKVIEMEPNYINVYYNLAVAHSHLGEACCDVESYNRANDYFEAFLALRNEDDCAWYEWGLTLLNLAQLINDPNHPENSKSVFEQSEKKLHQALALGNNDAHYVLSCLYSINNNIPACIYHLERAFANGKILNQESLYHDIWLDNVRETPAFRNFLAQLHKKE